MLTRTPRKTIAVAGGDALSGEVSRPILAKREPKAWKAASDFSGISAMLKSLM